MTVEDVFLLTLAMIGVLAFGVGIGYELRGYREEARRGRTTGGTE